MSQKIIIFIGTAKHTLLNGSYIDAADGMEQTVGQRNGKGGDSMAAKSEVLS
jgi:hypothetical protein